MLHRSLHTWYVMMEHSSGLLAGLPVRSGRDSLPGLLVNSES